MKNRLYFLFHFSKTPKEKSSAAVISYNPSGKVEIATEGQGQTETLAPVSTIIILLEVCCLVSRAA